MNSVNLCEEQPSPPQSPRASSPHISVLLTVSIFALILPRVPLPALRAALRDVERGPFLALMISNALFYFAWDTLVLTVAVRWFHGAVRYRELLPVRAASYVVGFFNTNVGRGAMAAYLSRRLQAPFLELGSTVLFLVLLLVLAVGGVAAWFALRRPKLPPPPTAERLAQLNQVER